MDSTNTTAGAGCAISDAIKSFTSFCAMAGVIMFFCRILHIFTGNYLHQPPIISELALGLILGNIPFVRRLVSPRMEDGFLVIGNFSSVMYMFALGLEMEPLAILLSPGPAAKIAFASILANSCLLTVSYFILSSFSAFREIMEQVGSRGPAAITFIVMFNATTSPIITSMITELRLSQLEIGRLAIHSGLANDLFCSFIMAILVPLLAQNKTNMFIIGPSVVAELVFVKFVMGYIIKQVNKRNPQGKKMMGSDITFVVLMVLLLCFLAVTFHYDCKMNAFLIGLALPRHGRVSNLLIEKVNHILATFFLPVYMAMAGIKLQFFPQHGEALGSSMYMMFILNFVSFVGKLIGTLIICFRKGLHWLEAINLAVILNIKGYSHIIFSMHARTSGLISETSFIVIVVMVIASIVYVPVTVSFIAKKVRKINGGEARQKGLQWHDPKSVLRITIGLHEPQNAVSSMSLIEHMQYGAASKTIVHAVDMIELNPQIRAALVYKEGTDLEMIADNQVMELREQIATALDSQIKPSARERITVNRSLAVSQFSEMHDKICHRAHDSLSVLIVLPFHKNLTPNGSMDSGHPGFRTVNENVLHHARCSTAILVDRGLGDNDTPSTSNTSMDVVAVITGGADDREALACAGMMAQHPAVRLLVVRLIEDRDAIAADGRRAFTAIPPQKEKEMKEDNEYFAEFYQTLVKGTNVQYREKLVKNSSGVVKVLRELEEDNYQLFITGQGTERTSILTAGMIEFSECPELGAIGDFLASSEFSSSASVLVIHQHNPARDAEHVSDEFSRQSV